MYCSYLETGELSLIRDVKKELALPTTNEAVKRISVVLHALRQTFSTEAADDFLNRLPDFLKLVFASRWKRNEPRLAVEHLDELVSVVMARDILYGENLFKTEVQTLSVVILTLKKLLKLDELQTFDGLSANILQELNDVPAESAMV